MSTTLLDLTSEAVELDNALALLEDPNHPDVEVILKRMLDLSSETDTKVDSYCAFIRELELRAAARKEEAARLTTRAKVSENLVTNLKTRLLDTFSTMDLTKLETKLFTVTRCKNGGKLSLIVDEDKVTDEYKKTVTKTSVDSDKIREALNDEKDITFARYAERGEHVRIK